MCTNVCGSSGSSRNDFVVIEEIHTLQENVSNASQPTSASLHTDAEARALDRLEDSRQTSPKGPVLLTSRSCHIERQTSGKISQSPSADAVTTGPVLLTSRNSYVETQKASKHCQSSITEVQAVSSCPLPNFNGRWVMTKVEGDMEQLLVDAGVSWAVRKMIKSANWGIGKNFQEISQNGNEFVIVHRQPMTTTTMRFCVGNGYQETLGVDGKPVLCDAEWDEQSLVIECKTKAGKTFAPARRYLQAGCMVIETATSKGQVVRRSFSKQ